MKTKLLFTVFVAFSLLFCLLLVSCGTKDNTDVTDESHEHEYGEWVETEKATCTETGEKEKKCSCGKTKTSEVEPLGHEYIEDYCIYCGEREPSEGIVYELNVDRQSYRVEMYGECTDTVVCIPSEYMGKPVTKIRDCAFMNCKDITEVVLPESITEIGEAAFKDCENLAEINIPSKVTMILSRTFSGTSLTNVVIPEGVTYIGIAFSRCEKLKSITIPKTVTAIADMAFSECTNIENVYISDIGAWCEMGFGWDASTPLYYGGSLYLNGELVTDLVIPEGVTKIEDHAFAWCKDLHSVTIPSSVTGIGKGAFKFCQNLTSVVIPQSVSDIGYSVFYRCNNLTIYCQAESKPSVWRDDWNSNVYNSTTIPVEWGYQTEK